MKRIVVGILLFLFAFTSFAQDSKEGLLKFLGIPIDGPKEEMVRKIMGKGFIYNEYHDCLTGQFNGKNVDVYVVDNHGLTYRVYVSFPETTEYRIRSEFNNLYSQFRMNNKYAFMKGIEEIPQKEDISYEMSINNTQYANSFVYISPDFFNQDEAIKIKELMESDNKSKDEIDELRQALADSMLSKIDTTDVKGYQSVIPLFLSVISANVWFTIIKDGPDYRIGLYYDNLNNAPRGEDL